MIEYRISLSLRQILALILLFVVTTVHFAYNEGAPSQPTSAPYGGVVAHEQEPYEQLEVDGAESREEAATIEDDAEEESRLNRSASSVSVSDLHRITNDERTRREIGLLLLNEELNQAATTKCVDMVAVDYYSHTAPDGSTPWDLLDSFGIERFGAAENINTGRSSSSEFIQSWMRSHGHRVNILNPRYTDVGYGVCRARNYQGMRDTLVVVQLLIRADSN